MTVSRENLLVMSRLADELVQMLQREVEVCKQRLHSSGQALDGARIRAEAWRTLVEFSDPTERLGVAAPGEEMVGELRPDDGQPLGVPAHGDRAWRPRMADER
ncbi:MAG: hypothetical protein ACYC6M_09130 [Terriglobales bacterium]